MIPMIRVVIIDDDKPSVDVLAEALKGFAHVEVVDVAYNGMDGAAAVFAHKPQLLFLDIELPDANGMDFLAGIRQKVAWEMRVVFYTSYERYLLQALRMQAFDFLLKPYQYEELAALIERAREKIRTGTHEPEQPMHWTATSNDRKFAMQTITGLLILRKSDILYFQYAAQSRSWQMMLTDGSIHRLRLSIKGHEILNISPSFIQISQDIILNGDYLIYIENKTFRCVLSPPHSHIDIKASKRYYSKIKETLEII